MKITLSKSQWNQIGRKAGWISKSDAMDENETTQPKTILNGMTKQKAARFVNNILSNAPSKGLFSDDDWSGITKVFHTLRENGIDYDLKSAKYSHNAEGIPNAKTWRFEIEFLNDKNRPTKLFGVIVAAGAGSVQYPLDKYDITAYVS